MWQTSSVAEQARIQKMNPVQQKISCVFVTSVKEESSSKRKYQPFRVSATIDVTEKAQSDDIASAKITEKMDGTCCLIHDFQGQPWLWARHDRKPSKAGERKLAQLKKSLQNVKKNEDQYAADFFWDASKDFKEVPAHWMPASRLEIRNGIAMPDGIGHTPGWVPVEMNSRQHCWHLSAVDYTLGLALVLRQSEEDNNDLIIESLPLSSLSGQTCELVGTCINGNPYNIGSKKCPIHFLIPHGSLTLTCPYPMDYNALCNWFDSSSGEGQVEGIVWHCANGELHKVHRHHLNLNWPVPEPKMCHRKVTVNVELPSSDVDKMAKRGQTLFSLLSSLNGHNIDSIRDLHKTIEIVNDMKS